MSQTILQYKQINDRVLRNIIEIHAYKYALLYFVVVTATLTSMAA